MLIVITQPEKIGLLFLKKNFLRTIILIIIIKKLLLILYCKCTLLRFHANAAGKFWDFESSGAAYTKVVWMLLASAVILKTPLESVASEKNHNYGGYGN